MSAKKAESIVADLWERAGLDLEWSNGVPRSGVVLAVNLLDRGVPSHVVIELLADFVYDVAKEAGKP